MSAKPSCKTCRFWEPGLLNDAGKGTHVAKDRGECRKDPPVANLQDNHRGLWPICLATDFCGAWEAVI